jgi:predicted MFS family arabinose efflux permease
VAGSSIFGMEDLHILNLGAYFVCGSLLVSLLIEQIDSEKNILLGFIMIFIASIYFNYYDSEKHIIVPVIFLFIGFIRLPFFRTFGKRRDLSYGIYIYSVPIQETLIFFF